MMFDISFALLKGCSADFTCEFPDVLESLTGTDVNFELVTSATLRPLKLFYEHNVARVLRGYVFVQEHLDDVGEWEGTEISIIGSSEGEVVKARPLGEKVRDAMMDPKATDIQEAELLVNLSLD